MMRHASRIGLSLRRFTSSMPSRVLDRFALLQTEVRRIAPARAHTGACQCHALLQMVCLAATI